MGKSKNIPAREKYLSFIHLEKEEKEIIEKDLNSPEYIHFKQDNRKDLLLPEKYSAENTFSLIEKQISTNVSKKRKLNWKRWSIAASLAILISLAGTYFSREKGQSPQLCFTTSYGEIKQITLPDSSVVILNSMSTISFPKKFKKEKREVYLNGEAYFSVTKNKNKTFVVNAGDINIEVLGTQFNVHAYENEDIISTVLVEGSIAIRNKQNESIILKPNECAYYNKTSKKLKIETKENVSSINEWQYGKLSFDNRSLENIFHTLERRYNIEFSVENEQLKKTKITARFIHNESIDSILDILGNTGNFSYKKQGNKFIITEKA